MINLTMMVAAACLNGAWPAKCGATAPGACTNEPAALSSFRPGEVKVSGSITGTPRWAELWDASQTGTGKWGETCASAYLMRLCARMSEWEGRAVLFDLWDLDPTKPLLWKPDVHAVEVTLRLRHRQRPEGRVR